MGMAERSQSSYRLMPGNEICEKTLREIGKNVHQHLSISEQASDGSSGRTENLFHDVLMTAGSSQISTTHGAAACNALSACLDWATHKGHPEIRSLVFSEPIFRACLDVYYERAETTKAKPLKQLLISTTNLLSRNPLPELQERLRNDALLQAQGEVLDKADTTTVRSALQVIDCFLHKELITSSDLLSLFGNGAKEVDATNRQNDGEASRKISTHGRSGRDFVFACIEWLAYPNVAPIASRLVSSLLSKLPFSPTLDIGSRTYDSLGTQGWFAAVKDFLTKKPELLDVFEDNLLQKLIQSNDHLSQILQSLPITQIIQGEIRDLTDTDIYLSLICLRQGYRLRKDDSRSEGTYTSKI